MKETANTQRESRPNELALQEKILDLASALISCNSVTPADSGCQNILIDRLEAAGFVVENMPFGEIPNFWATHGAGEPCFAFAGHTDVVPTGPLEDWDPPPFSPSVIDGMLTGRGAADMKGNLAAMAVAAIEFVREHPNHKGKIAFLVTGDEEATAENGTIKVVEALKARNEKITWCVVGEPSSVKSVGDTIKNGRRGSMTGHLTIKGVQGHVAYPERSLNPIHKFAPALAELCSLTWDKGNEFFPPTSFQISNMNSGTGADNVIPADLKVIFNFRFCTESTPESLRSRLEDVLAKHGLNYELKCRVSGQPFLTARGRLLDVALSSIKKIIGTEAEPSTTGGTSDARFIAPLGTEVIEIGPLNATIHKLNERISLADLTILISVYRDMLETLLQS